MRFADLPFLSDYVLNPRWLTYGVYTIMYSDRAIAQKGRITTRDVVDILRAASLAEPDEAKRKLRYPPERCGLVADAMVAFGVAYRLQRDPNRLVIPALLEAEQPAHDFRGEGALEFQFDFKGFLPRHVLPGLIVAHHTDIAQGADGREIVWQNGVLLRPGHALDAEALVKADYHERHIDILVSGSDAGVYLGQLCHTIHTALKTMPDLPVEENVRLRPHMRMGGGDLARPDERPVWLRYDIVRTAQRNNLRQLPGPDGHLYELDRILAAGPVSPDLVPADVFISYAREDRPLVEALEADLRKAGISVWWDRELRADHASFRDTLAQRIDHARAVVVLWTERSVAKPFVRAEASRAGDRVMCLRDPALDVKLIPLPFGERHIPLIGDRAGLVAALAAKGIGARQH